MEPIIDTYSPKESGLARLHVPFRETLWGLLEDMGPTLSVRKYSSDGISYLVDESCLRIKPVQSRLDFEPKGYLVTDSGMITDHLGNPFAPIHFFRFGIDLNTIIDSIYTVTLGEGENERFFPNDLRRIPVYNEIFKPLRKSFPTVFGGTLISALEPGEYYPLTVGGGYVSPFQESLRKRT